MKRRKSKQGKQVLRPGTSTLFMEDINPRAAEILQLDVQEDQGGDDLFYSARLRTIISRPRRSKLLHYIAAGGIRQMQRSSADQLLERQQQRFKVFLLITFLIWVLFYFIPSV